ncbi:MAG: prepilin-type N-terminal cleavage/methylation domain-containing protein [Proteobacteria bacterium]|nr:prepilin-type N-terminal cleavage/methylation domain-containing protein [Pseudomonadota bacterium]
MHVCKSERPEPENGFTLIELSIVIVIIGLIVAGVVGGQSLVEQAKLRNIVSDFNKFSIATSAFKIEYGENAGDLSKAEQYFGTTDCPNFVGVGYTCRCNGNGNKRVGPESITGEVHERMRFWQHLALASVLEGNFDGGCDYRYTGTEAIGRTIPAGSFPATAYTIMDRNNTNGTDIHLGKRHVEASSFVTIYNAGFINAPTAQSLDSKIDDGIANTGKVRGLDSPNTGSPTGTGNCVDGSDQYILSSIEKDCYIQYEMLN